MARGRKPMDIDTDNVNDVQIDLEEVMEKEQVIIPASSAIKEQREYQDVNNDSDMINCLKNEKVNVKFINKARTSVTDPKHIYYGGMAPTSEHVFTTPMLRTGGYTNVLTKDEMKFLEYKMGMEPGSLSVYKRENNFWDDSNIEGVGAIELKKGDNIFDLSDPMDYIKVKILKANKQIIASSMQELQDTPKATYRFVVINENDSSKDATLHVTMKSKAYMEFGSMKDNDDKMRTVIELFEGRPVSAKSSNDFLQGKIGEIIETNTKMFLNIVTDPLLDNKVLIKKAIDAGIIVNRGTFLYLKDTNTPLCGDGQDPTLSVAAKYLSLPRQQELKFRIEAELKK